MISSLGALLIAGLTGFFLGVMYFAWLWRSVASLATAKRAPSGLLFDAVLRFSALAAVVAVLLWFEIAPLLLLLGGLGFFLARLVATTVLVRPAREL